MPWIASTWQSRRPAGESAGRVCNRPRRLVPFLSDSNSVVGLWNAKSRRERGCAPCAARSGLARGFRGYGWPPSDLLSSAGLAETDGKDWAPPGRRPGEAAVRDALTWLEIHGGSPEVVEHWKGVLVGEGEADAAQPVPEDQPIQHRRRTRRRRRRFRPQPQ